MCTQFDFCIGGIFALLSNQIAHPKKEEKKRDIIKFYGQLILILFPNQTLSNYWMNMRGILMVLMMKRSFLWTKLTLQWELNALCVHASFLLLPTFKHFFKWKLHCKFQSLPLPLYAGNVSTGPLSLQQLQSEANVWPKSQYQFFFSLSALKSEISFLTSVIYLNIKKKFLILSFFLSLIHIWRCRRSTLCRSRWSPYH